MSRRRGRANAGHAASLRMFEDALADIASGRSRDVQPFLECLRGPYASLFVGADKMSRSNKIITVAVGVDSAELLSLRLELGGDAAEALDFPYLEGAYLPHMAVMSRAPRCMAVCLAAGSNANARDTAYDQTPLHYAGVCMAEEHREPNKERYLGSAGDAREYADIEAMLRELKAHGADISLIDARGNCAFVHGIEHGQFRTAGLLLDVFAREPASQHSKIRFAAILKALLAHEAVGRRPLSTSQHIDAWLTDFNTLLATLKSAWHEGGWDAPGKPGAHEPLQVAALVEAAVKRCAPLTLSWLCKEADAEAVRLGIQGQRAPLVHVALQAERPHMVGVLGASGVDLSLPSEHGHTALYSSLWLHRKDFTEQLLKHAPQEQLVRLLTHDDEEGLTALGFCTCYDRPEELPLLLRACERAWLGVSGLLERHAARTAHHWPVFAAVVEGRLPVLEQLLAAGLDPESPACREHVDPSEETGGLDMANLGQPSERTETLTLLMCAASTGNLRAVELLLAAGADARCSPPGNRRFPDAVSMVLRGLQLEAPQELERPDAELAALVEPWLRNWQQEAMEAKCGVKLHDPPEPSEALSEWLEEWGGDAGVGERFQCLLLLLWHGAALARRQVGELLALLDVSGEAEEEGLAGAALENFLFERAKQCGCCGLVGRWRRCECKRVWYCGRACQKRHWKAGHELECPLAQQL